MKNCGDYSLAGEGEKLLVPGTPEYMVMSSLLMTLAYVIAMVPC